MRKSYENKQLQLNADLAEHKKGAIISIKTDKYGTPIDRYWRDRLKDSKIDNCVEFVSKKKASPSKKSIDKEN